MRRALLRLGVACLCHSGVAESQTVAVETQHTIGVSSESISAFASQLHMLGEMKPGLRFDIEGTWGTRSGEGSDVFGTAYPYDGNPELINAYVEWVRPTARGLRAVKAGRYRTPFGISAASEHAYVGFLRAPLIRYGGYYALSSGYIEHGASVVLGHPRLSIETSVGMPADVGDAIRRSSVGATVRAEAAAGPIVLGASYINTSPYPPATYALGRTQFAGVDVRWMRNGWLMRGEWLGGRPFDGTSTEGGYVDLMVHKPVLGPATLLARAEKLGYDAIAPFALYTHRYTVGSRIRLWKGLSLFATAVHQGGQLTQRRATAVDAAVSYSLRHDF